MVLLLLLLLLLCHGYCLAIHYLFVPEDLVANQCMTHTHIYIYIYICTVLYINNHLLVNIQRAHNLQRKKTEPRYYSFVLIKVNTHHKVTVDPLSQYVTIWSNLPSPSFYETDLTWHKYPPFPSQGETTHLCNCKILAMKVITQWITVDPEFLSHHVWCQQRKSSAHGQLKQQFNRMENFYLGLTISVNNSTNQCIIPAVASKLVTPLNVCWTCWIYISTVPNTPTSQPSEHLTTHV